MISCSRGIHTGKQCNSIHWILLLLFRCFESAVQMLDIRLSNGSVLIMCLEGHQCSACGQK